MSKIIRIEFISWHDDNLLAGYFGNKKSRELVARKYYWLIFKADIESYVKRCNVYLASKTIKYKSYGDLQFF